MGSNHKKWRSKISWHTPFKENFFFIKSRSLSRRQLQDLNSRSQLQKLHLGSSSKSSISGSQLKDLNIWEPAQGSQYLGASSRDPPGPEYFPVRVKDFFDTLRVDLSNYLDRPCYLYLEAQTSISGNLCFFRQKTLFSSSGNPVLYIWKPCSLHLETLFTHIKTYYH